MAERESGPAALMNMGPNLSALAEITEAVQAGAGLPEVLRAAGRALDASLILIDRSASILAVTARSPADERSLMRDADDVVTLELKVADAAVGQLRMRVRDRHPDPSMLSLVTTLIASEVERVRAPERASEEAATAFLRSVLRGDGAADSGDLVARGKELGIDLAAGSAVLVVRAHPRSATEDDWRRRLLAVAGRGARSIASGALAAPSEQDAGTVLMLVPDADGTTATRVSAAVLRELESGLGGFVLAIGRSRRAEDPKDLKRAGNEAMLSANVVEGEYLSELAFEATGTYQLLLPYMSDPAELKRFYNDTVRPLVAYDEQYETDLLGTLATFLDCDANVNATAARLITHRHTIRYRFERVRELTGLDVQSTDGREKLSLGLKAMRVLGIAAPRGPATEPGAEGGRVPR
jgi:sugar diacid utilization regulator